MEDTRNGWQRYSDWLDRKEVAEEEDDEGERSEGGVWQKIEGEWVQITISQ